MRASKEWPASCCTDPNIWDDDLVSQFPPQYPQRQYPPMRQYPPTGQYPQAGPPAWSGGPAWSAPAGQRPWQQHQNWQQPAPHGGTWGHRPPAPPPRGNGALIAAVLVLVAAIAFGGYALSRDEEPRVATTRTTLVTRTQATTEITSREPETTTPVTSTAQTTPPRPTATTSTPPPTQAPVGVAVLPQRSWDALPGPHSNNTSWVVLQQNRLYRYDVPPMTCPAIPDGITSTQQFRSFSTNTLNCQHTGWAAVFTAMGKPLPKPKVTFISDAVQTPCGKAGDQVSFYCGTWDGSHYGIYVHTSLVEQSNSWWRLRAFETLAHEYGHHVQMMMGNMLAGAEIVEQGGMSQEERSRRLELQTSCWASRILVQTASTRFSEQDYDTFMLWSQQDQDEYHGSAASNQYWWQRGLYAKTAGDCNTYTVGSNRVS